MRQANTILQQEIKIKVKQQKCPRFEFNPRQVNDSSQSNQATDHLVSQDPYTTKKQFVVLAGNQYLVPTIRSDTLCVMQKMVNFGAG
jgi:hypothetical protein